MSVEQFKEINFRADSLAIIATAKEILKEYSNKVTLRQLYYRFVARAAIPNNQKSYKRLGSIISDARVGGLLDWNAIEDRARRPDIPGQFEDLNHLARAAVASYRLPRWRDQDNYVELWVEKDAISGVLVDLCDDLHVTLMVNRGYSSMSAMYESANRFLSRGAEKEHVLLYLGDHDPSGEDMVRDVRDRLAMFGANPEVRKIALTMAQIEEHDPPPNPVKSTDSRAAGYEDAHGSECWEVDALPPDVLQQLCRDSITEYMDEEKYEAVKDQEEKDKRAFTKAVEKLVKRGT